MTNLKKLLGRNKIPQEPYQMGTSLTWEVRKKSSFTSIHRKPASKPTLQMSMYFYEHLIFHT